MAIWQASRLTMIGSGIRGKAFWNEEFKFLVLERVKDLIEDLDAVRSLPFTLLFTPPMSLRNFSRFCSRLSFLVFTLESHFFIFWLSYYALDNSRFIPNRWMIYQDFFFGWRKEPTALLIMKIFSRKNLFSPSIHVQSKWTFQVRNVSQGSWFRKKG